MKQLLIICVFIFGVAKAQHVFVPLEFYNTYKADRLVRDSSQAVHSEIRPLSMFSFYQNSSSPLYQPSIKSLFRAKKQTLWVNPLINCSPMYVSGNHPANAFEGWAGVSVAVQLSQKMMIEGNFISGWYEPAPYMRRIVDSLKVVPGMGRAYHDGAHYSFQQSTFTLGWNANKHVQVFVGRGKQFIGEGYRSIYLGDYSSPTNYFRADVSVWRIKYMILYKQMNGSSGYPNNFGERFKKYQAAHYLSLNITKWWTVGAYETVVWGAEDSLQHRHFGIDYLNPIIFYRPVEYSIGSFDNYLLGASTAIRPTKDLTIYGGIMMDEYLMREILAPLFKKYSDSTIQTGSWRNKQAYQCGIKYHEPLGWKNATVIAEFNAVRPFTYSHTYAEKSYTNMNQVLAHPLGSNFIEWVGLVLWQPNRWNFGWRNTYSRKGYSDSRGNLGDDPLISNANRAHLVDNGGMYGFYMLQGRKVDVLNTRFEASYVLKPEWNFRVEAAIQYRWQRTAATVDNTVIYQLGIRTALWNEYRDL